MAPPLCNQEKTSAQQHEKQRSTAALLFTFHPVANFREFYPRTSYTVKKMLTTANLQMVNGIDLVLQRLLSCVWYSARLETMDLYQRCHKRNLRMECNGHVSQTVYVLHYCC